MANPRTLKSPYARGKRHMLLSLAAMPAIMWGIPFNAAALGIWTSSVILWVIMPLAVLLLLLGGFGSFLIRCPKCGKSVFVKYLYGFFAYSVPWPERQCSRCRNDLTEPPTISDLERAT